MFHTAITRIVLDLTISPFLLCFIFLQKKTCLPDRPVLSLSPPHPLYPSILLYLLSLPSFSLPKFHAFRLAVQKYQAFNEQTEYMKYHTENNSPETTLFWSSSPLNENNQFWSSSPLNEKNSPEIHNFLLCYPYFHTEIHSICPTSVHSVFTIPLLSICSKLGLFEISKNRSKYL